MQHPCFLIAYRYLYASSGNRFARLTQLLAVCGMGLGVAVLLIISSVFNGFHEVLVRLYPTDVHYVHARQIQKDASWPNLSQSLSARSDVLALYPTKTHYAAVFTDNTMQPVLLEGYDSQVKPKWFNVDSKDAAVPVIPVMIGSVLESRLYLAQGDRFQVTTALQTPSGVQPKNLRLQSQAAIPLAYSQGLHALRIALPMASLNAALGDKPQAFSHVVIELARSDNPLLRVQALNEQFESWLFQLEEDTSLSILSSLAMQKRLMLCVLSLVVVLAAFNLIAGLTIIVSERKQEIAVLQTMGFAKTQIIAVFLIQGFILALLGCVIGLVVGLPIAFNTEAIMAAIEAWLGMKIIGGDVFFLGYLPSRVFVMDAVIIAMATCSLSLLFSIMPAYYASRVQPALSLRYDQ